MVESVYSLLPELVDYYDYKIWVETPYQERLARGIERDGLDARERWVRDWMPAEQRYVRDHRPELADDMRVDGSRSTGFDFDEEFVRSG